MTDNALLKVGNAEKHLIQLKAFLAKERPAHGVLKTDVRDFTRVFHIEENQKVVKEASLICGDVVHNLRSALDHAYWDILAPLTKGLSDREKR
jgi:hypothetical protein